ncbi:hypothetical protein BH11PSE14_BH11PSE14_22250 [soil metagenome]
MSADAANPAMHDANLGVPTAWWARLGHDLRGPVSPMRLAVQVLRSDRCTALEREEALQLLDRQVDRLLGEIDDVAELMRLRAGTWVLRAGHGDLNLILDTVSGRASLTRRLQERGQSLRVCDAGQPVEIEHDAERLGAILEFVLHKSAELSPRGSQLRLGLRDEGSIACLEIDGVGAALFEDVELAWLLGGEGVDPLQVSLRPVLLRAVADRHGLSLRAMPLQSRLELCVPVAIAAA